VSQELLFFISPEEFTSRQNTKYNMNVSFDEDKEICSCCDSDLYNQPPFSREKATLGFFVKDRSKEHLLNAIMQQADRERLSEYWRGRGS
jgi:hypothetical protein